MTPSEVWIRSHSRCRNHFLPSQGPGLCGYSFLNSLARAQARAQFGGGESHSVRERGKGFCILWLRYTGRLGTPRSRVRSSSLGTSGSRFRGEERGSFSAELTVSSQKGRTASWTVWGLHFKIKQPHPCSTEFTVNIRERQKNNLTWWLPHFKQHMKCQL